MPNLFPLWAQSASQFMVRQEYKTEIITSRKGREQRRALRQTPRKVLEYSGAMLPTLWRRIRAVLVTGQRIQWYCADPSRAMTTTAAASGAGPFSVNTVTDWAAVDVLVALQYGTQFELRTITAVGGADVTLTTGTFPDWPLGTSIYIALLGYLSAELQQQTIVSDALLAKVTFEVDPISEPDDPINTLTTAWKDREVFPFQPLRLAPIQTNLKQLREVVDAGQGIIARFHPIPFTSRYFQATYTTTLSDFIDRIVDLHRRCKGARGEFYMPTWEHELDPIVDATAGSTSLEVEGTEIATYYVGSTIYQEIAIIRDLTYTTNGVADIEYNTVTAVNVSGSNSVLTLVNPLIGDVPAGTMVCWMPCWRFANDAVEFQYLAARRQADRPFMSTVLNLVALENFLPTTDLLLSLLGGSGGAGGGAGGGGAGGTPPSAPTILSVTDSF